jgi:hypothetical protein
MANPFAGLLTGGSPAASAAPVSAAPTGGNAFAGLLTGNAPSGMPISASMSPVAPLSPVTSPSANPEASLTPEIPASALTGSLGGGYGASNIPDASSGKPLLTYENPAAKSSQLLSDRTAPAFDPTVPQKVDPATLQDPRMKETLSQAIKSAVGGTAYSELDHIMPLELGGSNNKSNLRLEPGQNTNAKYNPSTNPTLTDPLENSIAQAVHNGNISLVDGWKQMAQAKGVTLPEDGGAVPNLVQSGIQPNTEPNEQPKPSILDNAASFIRNAFTPQTENKVFDALGGNAIMHPIQTLNTIVNNAKQGIDTNIQNLASSAKDIVAPNQSASQRTASVLNFLTSAASTAMLPISEPFSIASQLPVLKPAADLTGIIFDKTGQIGGFAADKLLSALPISQQAKDNLASSVHNAGSLAGQIVLGGYIYGKTTGMMDANGEITPAQEQNIVQDAQAKAQEVKDAPVGAPTANFGGDIHPQAETPLAPKSEAPTETTPNSTEKIPEVAPIEGTGETKTSGLAQGVQEKAVEAKLTRGFGDLPEYKTVNMKDQAAKAVDLVTNNYDQALRIAMGQEKAPEGILPESVFVAVENKAHSENDVNTLRDLATQSSLTSEATTMGQRIRTLAERDPESPVGVIKDLQSAREKAATEKLGKGGNLDKAKASIAEDIKTEIKKAAPKAKDWSSFVDSIKC